MRNQLKSKVLTKQDAQRRTKKHQTDLAGLQKGWVQLGKDVAESIDLGVPGKLGMNADEWFKRTFRQSRSHIFEQVKNYRALQSVPIEKLERIPPSSAKELTRLPEKMRKDPELIEKAVTQSPAEFKETVATIREEKFGIVPDPWKTHAVRVPAVVDALIVMAEEKMARVLQLDLEDETVRMKNLVVVWEVIAALINDTPEEWLVVETTGGGPLEDLVVRTKSGRRLNGSAEITSTPTRLLPPMAASTLSESTKSAGTSKSGSVTGTTA